MIAIVGAGAAGWSAAKALRELAYDGDIRLFGSEAEIPYERPTLSKSFLTDPELEHPPSLAGEAAPACDVELQLGTKVVSIDRQSRALATADGRQLGYDRLLLATGAEPRRLSLPGSELPGIHYLREAPEARDLRAELRPGARIAIVGGGPIGLEVASSALARSCEATVIEVAPRVMGRIVPSELARTLEQLHRARGINIHTAVRPVAFEGARDRVAGVRLAGGQVIAADTVLVGVGAIPRTDLAAAAGLPVDNGVVVDEQFRTPDERIFAAGDVASVFHAGENRHVRIEQWRPAQEQGRRAAAALLDVSEPYRDVPWMWSDQDDLHIQMTGFGFDGTELVRRGDIGAREGLAYFGLRGDRLAAVCGVSLGTGIARTIRAAEMLIQRGTSVPVEALREPEQDFRKLARRLAEATCTP